MLDTFTLYCIVVATAVGGAILSWLFTWRRPEAVGARTWSLSLACLAVYFGLVVFRQHVNGFIGYSVANGVAVIGLGVMHFGSGQICRRPVRLWLHLAVAAVVMVVIAAFLLEPERHFRIRVMLVAAVTAIQSSLIVWMMLRSDADVSEDEVRARRLTAAVLGALASLQYARVVLHSPLWRGNEASILAGTALSHWTAVIFLLVCVGLPFLVVYVNEARAQAALIKAIADLQHALAEVKTLRGLIPICSSCRRIRETDNTWNNIERYLEAHSDAQLSHGVCPDCMVKLYPEYSAGLAQPPA